MADFEAQHEVLDKVFPIIEEANPGVKKINIAVSIDKFEQTHGNEALKAMGRFVDWARKNKNENLWMATSIVHDLNGCEDALMYPRTSSY